MEHTCVASLGGPKLYFVFVEQLYRIRAGGHVGPFD